MTATYQVYEPPRMSGDGDVTQQADQNLDNDYHQGTSDDGDENLPMFSTLIFSLGSLFVTAVFLVYTVFEFRSTADFIIRISNGGTAKIQQIANTIVNQAKSIIQSSVPEIEQTAENVVTSIIGGITTTINSVTSVSGAILGLITDSFNEIADLIRDYGLQITQLALDALLPVVREIAVGLQFVLDVFQVMSAFWQALVSVVNNIINTFGPIF